MKIQEIKENAKHLILKWGFTIIRFNVKITDIFKLIFLHGCLRPCVQTRVIEALFWTLAQAEV